MKAPAFILWSLSHTEIKTNPLSSATELLLSCSLISTIKRVKERNGILICLPSSLYFFISLESYLHSGWKSQKKSHSTLRAKRATFTFWVDKSSLKMPKKIHFGEFLKTRILPSNSVTRQVTFNREKNGRKCQNINNQCDILSGFQTFWNYSYYSLSFLK